MNISFGAKLISSPEKFFLKTDSENDGKYIEQVFLATDRLLSSKPIDRSTHNDTVELIRMKRKKGSGYLIKYSSPDNGGFVADIPMTNKGDICGIFDTKSIFVQVVNALRTKYGKSHNLPLFATWEQIRDDTFGLTKEESEVFNSLSL